MTVTYNPSLVSDLDWVRFLVSKTVTTDTELQDEEIQAVIDSQPSNGQSGGKSSAVYYAAAVCLGRLHTGWMTKGKGVASKKVSRLSIVYGTGSGINIDIAIQDAVKNLRKEAARLLTLYTGGSHHIRIGSVRTST